MSSALLESFLVLVEVYASWSYEAHLYVSSPVKSLAMHVACMPMSTLPIVTQ